FFQAEDGIRDFHVTGVQTCALPIFTMPENGKHLKLTIDRNIQLFIEEALAKMYEEYHPRAATVIAADPNTMEILGMASLPSYDRSEERRVGKAGRSWRLRYECTETR